MVPRVTTLRLIATHLPLLVICVYLNNNFVTSVVTFIFVIAKSAEERFQRAANEHSAVVKHNISSRGDSFDSSSDEDDLDEAKIFESVLNPLGCDIVLASS